jgi:hypothetical protein
VVSPPVSFKGFGQGFDGQAFDGQAFDGQAFDGQAFDALMKERSTPSCGKPTDAAGFGRPSLAAPGQTKTTP